MFTVPDASKRTVVLGRTGSGKTQFSMALFANQNWHVMPWVILDYKGDELIIALQEQFPRFVREIKPTDKPPTKPGIYVLRPLPDEDDDAIEIFLKRCWAQERVGIYIDEGYMIPANSRALKAILTQGRSRRVPVLALYQRPVYMSRFAVAQADFFAVFDQNDERDLATTKQFIKAAVAPNGRAITVFDKLPKYHCLWYDVSAGETVVLKPAPSADEILNLFRSRIGARAKQGAFI